MMKLHNELQSENKKFQSPISTPIGFTSQLLTEQQNDEVHLLKQEIEILKKEICAKEKQLDNNKEKQQDLIEVRLENERLKSLIKSNTANAMATNDSILVTELAAHRETVQKQNMEIEELKKQLLETANCSTLNQKYIQKCRSERKYMQLLKVMKQNCKLQAEKVLKLQQMLDNQKDSEWANQPHIRLSVWGAHRYIENIDTIIE